MDRSTLEKKPLAELREIAATLDLRGYQRMRKADLVSLIMDAGSTPAAEPSGGSDGSADGGSPAGSGGSETSTTGSGEQDRRGEPPRGGERRGQGRPPSERARPDGPAPTGGEHRGDGGERGSEPRGDDTDGDDGDRGRRERRRKPRGAPLSAGQQDGGDGAEVREGVLDLLPEGYGFLRVTGYTAGQKDVYVSQSLVRRLDLRRGDLIAGPIRRNKNNDKFPALARVDTVDGEPLPQSPAERRPQFRDLTPLFPEERFDLDQGPQTPAAMRIADLLAPIGRGQRGLVVSPPKAGKTTILKQLAASIEANHPDVHVMVLLVDERPEEVTDFARSCDGEVISSTFDRPAEDHTQIAELAIERAKRLVERGRDVVLLLDSLTRLARAYNLAVPTSGKVLSGGLDAAALYPAKRFFGAARNIEDGGSLTIVATALVETGSRMDDVIFEEFKGTGNLELRLDRALEQRRIFPAIDVHASGTRREELLLDPDDLEAVRALRRGLAALEPQDAAERLTERLKATASNRELLRSVADAVAS